MAVRYYETRFLKATDKRFLSSVDKFDPFSLMTGFKKLTISLNLSDCSATLAMNIYSSDDDVAIFNFKINMLYLELQDTLVLKIFSHYHFYIIL